MASMGQEAAMSFAEFSKANRRKCLLCKIFEAHPALAADIRTVAKPSPSLMVKYIKKTVGEIITHDVVIDHYRRGHEERDK